MYWILEGIDHSSNITSFKTGASRRDTFDVINKTKHMFSSNSLESLAKLTDAQLNTNHTRDHAKEYDSETNSNTHYNKFSLSDSKYNKSGTESPITNSYHSTVRNEKYITTTVRDNDYDYSTNFLPIENSIAGGAKAIKVSNKPDGILGRPFEFESESKFII
jgi:filamin